MQGEWEIMHSYIECEINGFNPVLLLICGCERWIAADEIASLHLTAYKMKWITYPEKILS